MDLFYKILLSIIYICMFLIAYGNSRRMDEIEKKIGIITETLEVANEKANEKESK